MLRRPFSSAIVASAEGVIPCSVIVTSEGVSVEASVMNAPVTCDVALELVSKARELADTLGGTVGAALLGSGVEDCALRFQRKSKILLKSRSPVTFGRGSIWQPAGNLV